MGDTLSVEQKKKFENKLQFVQKTEDPCFGHIDIFRFKEPPYEYLMDFQKTFMEGDTRYQLYAENIKKLKEREHKNLAKIHFTEVCQCILSYIVENHMCIKDTKVHTYCNYYNFTLKQAADKKKVRDSRFNEAELAYIMSCLLEVAVYLKSSEVVFGDYRAERIYMSPQGYIKLFTLQLEKENKHTAYYKALVDKTLLDQLILSPQQLIFIQQLQYEPKLDIYKAQVFAIGMIILEMMTLDKTKFYYTEDKTGFKMGRISFDISSLSSEYSAQFLDILRSCLTQNPNDRTTLEVANSRIEQLRKRAQNVSYCIRLQQDDQNTKKKPSISTRGQYILAGIQKKLNPSPITTLASSSSSGFTSKHTSIYQQSSRKYYK